MIKCKECGFEAARLQWTHFRYNCTGRFKNGKEYRNAYPDALLVDPALAKKTAITLENFIKKYGEIEGEIKWNSYKEKQAKSNSLEYKKEKYGWTADTFSTFNKSRAVTLENMIAKHGEIKGIELWNQYCDRQRYTKTKEYLISKYGEPLGLQKYLEINRKKSEPHDPKLLAEKLKISIDQAVSIIVSRGSYKYTSLLEQEFISLLELKIGPLDHTSLKLPFGKWISSISKYVVYDIKHKDCIIEFNGDYWHANPKIYNKNDLIRGTSALDIWKKDSIKLNEATRLGYRTLTVWESDFIKNKQAIVEETVKWILNEQQLNQ